MKRILPLVVLVLVAFGLGYALRGGSSGGSAEHAHEASAETTLWTCSMHPQIQLPEPGSCPICGMDLIPAGKGTSDDGPAASLTLSPAAQARAQVRTSVVARRPVSTTLRLGGLLQPDESRVKLITAWVTGRIERMHVDFTGETVRQGEPLFTLYSPQLYAAQEELVQARRLAEDPEASASSRDLARGTVEAARERLAEWGLSGDDIDRIATEGARDRVEVRSPMDGIVLEKQALEGDYVKVGQPVYRVADLGQLWLQVNAYEEDLPWIHAGLDVDFTTDAFPGRTFSGKVAFVDPVLDPKTRTVKVRVEVGNPDGRLRPEMFARVRIHVPLGDEGTPPLVIPASAPLVTGRRALVYVEEEPGRFTARDVKLGPTAGEWVVVEEGLREGESVVSEGAFRIDSDLQIRGRPSMMNPESEPTPRTDGEVSPLFRTYLGTVLDGYFAVTAALGRDDPAPARKGAEDLVSALHQAPVGGVSGEAAAVWEAQAARVEHAAEAIASAGDLETQRAAYFELSEAMVSLARTLGTGGADPVFVYHCPMAGENGADWMQPDDDIRNPYYGASMLKCGSITGTLVGGQ